MYTNSHAHTLMYAYIYLRFIYVYEYMEVPYGVLLCAYT